MDTFDSVFVQFFYYQSNVIFCNDFVAPAHPGTKCPFGVTENSTQIPADTKKLPHPGLRIPSNRIHTLLMRQLPDHMPDLYIQERLRRAACIRHYHYYRYAHYSPQVFQLLHGCKNVLFYSLSRGYNYFHDYSVPHGCNHF